MEKYEGDKRGWNRMKGRRGDGIVGRGEEGMEYNEGEE